jgi:NitT/TauT family transport system substrate-binding protein
MSHLAKYPEAWKKIIQVWDRTVRYIQDPATRQDVLNIMAKCVGVAPEPYEQFMNGTHLLDLKANQQVFKKSNDLTSMYGSTYHVNQFNLNHGVYEVKLDLDGLIYPQLHLYLRRKKSQAKRGELLGLKDDHTQALCVAAVSNHFDLSLE